MKMNDLFLYRIIFDKKKSLHAFSSHRATIFRTKSVMLLFKDFKKNISLKVPPSFYHITDTTLRRIDNIELDGLDGAKILGSICDKTAGCETGIVFFNDGLHYAYVVTPRYITLLVCRRDVTNERDIDAYIARLRCVLIGTYHIDCNTGEIQPVVFNPLDILFNKNGYRPEQFDKDEARLLHRLLKELNAAGLISDGTITLPAVQATPTGSIYLRAYSDKWNDLQRSFRSFLFIKLAKRIDTVRISEADADGRRWIPSGKSHSIIQVDTTYDENLHVINPFAVKGHFRNQPCGKERSDTRLIYIDAFMKNGYTRPSKTSATE